LKEPFAPFLDSLTKAALMPVSPTAVETYGEDYAEHPTGTGPFMFKEEIPNERLVLVKNPDYNWAPDYYNHQGPPYLDEIVVHNVDEDSTRMAMIEAGELDMVYNPLARMLPDFEADPNFYIHYATRPGVPRVVVLNTERWPFDDPQVRMAVAYAIDKARVLEETFEGIGGVASVILTPGLFGHCEECVADAPTYDPERAKELLAEAGWEDTDGDGILEKDGQPFIVDYGTIPGMPFDITDQIWQANLKDVGIQMEIEGEEQAAYLQHMVEGKWNMAGMLFVATDPDVLYTILHSDSIDTQWNTPRYNNPEMDALLEQGRVTLDPVARAQIYEDIQRLVLEENPYIPYYVIKNPYLLNSRVHDFRADTQAFLDFYDAWVSD
jgi:peptide/nickel transport system substrate-binding protein